jgi:biopolymer transport protein TolQ
MIPEVTSDISFVQLILGASLIVQLVLVALLLASLASWAIIFQKRRVLSDALNASEEFESTFWSGTDLATLHRRSSRQDGGARRGMETIFEAGFREFGRLRGEDGMAPAQALETARRAMRVSQRKEIDRLEQNLATLATVGSTSPYVGLFGTVWGIMNAFSSLGTAQHATIAQVAPGIAEALVATAMGLFAAIPAVIAYNRYADQVDRLESRYDTFMEEFSNILSRYAAGQEA